ncbi:hypothetical protein NP493_4070g00002 [Ridgeia piscesae]|uniref:Uncharacterized protein n=1 Tax=Ridgeia piscesae TaxID=27915 RepID=A0AAD9J268_RIDPI|nr:hypothetical protein NP493_4070g00002 [Ridgeia piscesae]
MEDARNRLPSVPAAERLPFLIAHLEGPAREEVRYAPEEEKDSVDKIFILLLSTFGENRSNAQLKRELYERRQRNRESLPLQFTCNLPEFDAHCVQGRDE